MVLLPDRAPARTVCRWVRFVVVSRHSCVALAGHTPNQSGLCSIGRFPFCKRQSDLPSLSLPCVSAATLRTHTTVPSVKGLQDSQECDGRHRSIQHDRPQRARVLTEKEAAAAAAVAAAMCCRRVVVGSGSSTNSLH